jgi:hypothetical protein
MLAAGRRGSGAAGRRVDGAAGRRGGRGEAGRAGRSGAGEWAGELAAGRRGGLASFVQLWETSFCFDVTLLARVLFLMVQVPFVNGHTLDEIYRFGGSATKKEIRRGRKPTECTDRWPFPLLAF